MNGKSAIQYHDAKIDTKAFLALAWIAMLGLYLYCDWFSLYRPGVLEGIAAGKMGPFDVSQAGLVLASLLMIVPILAPLATVLLPAKASRLANLILAPLYFLVNVGNLAGEAWAYYILFGILELALTVGIFIAALRWPRD